MPDNDQTHLLVDGDGERGKKDTAQGSTIGTSRSDFPVIDGYTVLGRLGTGAMGEVYRAKHLASGQEVALKIIARHLIDQPEVARRFDREIELLTRISHPSIAAAIDHGIYQGRVFLAMEMVRGPSLDALLKAQGPFAEADVLRLSMQVAQGLDYVFRSAGLIHRDIKPGNLLVIPTQGEEGDQVKIIDFGLARSTAGGGEGGLTMTGMVMGTPFYMSPEQVRGEKNLGVQTDIYALGCTLYHLLTGSPPYEGSSPGVIMTAHLHSIVPDPGRIVPSLSSPTRHLVMTAMAKLAGSRYADYGAFIRACDAALKAVATRDTKSIKLLLKPMVLTRTRSFQRSVTGDQSEVDPFAHELPARMRKQEADSASPPLPERKVATQPFAVRQPMTDVAAFTDQAAPRLVTAAEALLRAQTERIQRLQTSARIRRYAKAKEMTPYPGVTAVSDPDPLPITPGFSLGIVVPLLLLLAACITAAVWFALSKA